MKGKIKNFCGGFDFLRKLHILGVQSRENGTKTNVIRILP